MNTTTAILHYIINYKSFISKLIIGLNKKSIFAITISTIFLYLARRYLNYVMNQFLESLNKVKNFLFSRTSNNEPPNKFNHNDTSYSENPLVNPKFVSILKETSESYEDGNSREKQVEHDQNQKYYRTQPIKPLNTKEKPPFINDKTISQNSTTTNTELKSKPIFISAFSLVEKKPMSVVKETCNLMEKIIIEKGIKCCIQCNQMIRQQEMSEYKNHQEHRYVSRRVQKDEHNNCYTTLHY